TLPFRRVVAVAFPLLMLDAVPYFVHALPHSPGSVADTHLKDDGIDAGTQCPGVGAGLVRTGNPRCRTRPMRVVLDALGSRADGQPLLALGRGLAGAGYAVRIATHEPFRALVTDLGLDFAPIRLDPRAFLASDAGQDWVDSGENPVRFVLRLRRAVLPE